MSYRGVQGVVMLVLAAAAQANESQVALREGDGRDAVSLNCVLCHSLDYIPMNSPVMTPERWQATVRKMIDRMGAPITEPDAQVILRYLSEYYVQDGKR